MKDLGTSPVTASGAITTGDQRPSPAAHTAGPWNLSPSKEGGTKLLSGGGWAQFAQVVVQVDGAPDAEGEANARLIAAAPDMLAALREYEHDYCEGWCKEADGNFTDCGGCRARAAIAKATGAQP